MLNLLNFILLIIMLLMSMMQTFLLGVWVRYGKALHRGRVPLQNIVMTAGTYLLTAAIFSNLRDAPLHYSRWTILFFLSGLLLLSAGGFAAFQQVRQSDWRKAFLLLRTSPRDFPESG